MRKEDKERPKPLFDRRETRWYTRAAGIHTSMRLLLVVALFAWLVWSERLDFSRLFSMELGVFLVVGSALRGLSTFGPLFRWCILARAIGMNISWIEGLRIGLVGRFLGVVAPGWLGVDGARIYYGTNRDSSRSERAIATVLVDRLSDVAALVVFLAGVCIVRLSASFDAAIPSAALMLAIAAATTRVACWGHVVRYCRRVAEAAGEYRHRPGAIGTAFCIALVTHLVSFSGVWMLFRALGSTIPYIDVMTLQPLVAATRYVSVTPHGLGIADAIGDVAYRSLGSVVGAEVVFVSRLVTMTVGALCGVGLLFLPASDETYGSFEPKTETFKNSD